MARARRIFLVLRRLNNVLLHVTNVKSKYHHWTMRKTLLSDGINTLRAEILYIPSSDIIASSFNSGTVCMVNARISISRRSFPHSNSEDSTS